MNDDHVVAPKLQSKYNSISETFIDYWNWMSFSLNNWMIAIHHWKYHQFPPCRKISTSIILHRWSEAIPHSTSISLYLKLSFSFSVYLICFNPLLIQSNSIHSFLCLFAQMSLQWRLATACVCVCVCVRVCLSVFRLLCIHVVVLFWGKKN